MTYGCLSALIYRDKCQFLSVATEWMRQGALGEMSDLIEVN